MAKTASGRPQPVVEQVKEQVQEKSRIVADAAGSVVGGRVRSEVGARTGQAAVEVKAFAQAVRETSRSLREQGHEGQASVVDELAGRADRLAAYLGRADTSALLSDGKRLGQQVAELAQKEPLVVAAGAFTLGLLIPRWLGVGSEGS